MSQPVAVIGIDIGGTKIKVGAVEAVGAPRQLIASQQVATPRVAPGAFYDALAELVRAVKDQAVHSGWQVLPLVAVAHPGRLLPDGRLARGTTPNLGATPNQFDCIKPAHELEQRLAMRVVAENDAVAQMRFALAAVLDDPAVRPALLEETVVYLGPGTGLGGGAADVDRGGAVTPVTDGHFFDLQVPGIGDDTLTAEELLTGPAIARHIEQVNQRLSPPMVPAVAETIDRLLLAREVLRAHQQAAQRIAQQHAEILAAIVQTIHAGRIVKVRLDQSATGVARYVNEPDRAWSASDQAIVRGCRRFILGGSVGCSRGLGALLREEALRLLRQRGLAEVMIFQSPVTSADAGLLGVVMAIAAAG